MLFFIEIMGTIAFALQGASAAVEKKMDIFGVCIMGMSVAVGGGIIRDLILGITPPNAFQKPVYALVALAVSILIFFPFERKIIHQNQKFYDAFLFQTDSLGLGAFTVVGARAAYSQFPEANPFLVIFVAVLTGVGGGVLRDLFTGTIPYIFRKHFYATASLIGGACLVICRHFMTLEWAMVVGMVVVIILRELANRFKWNLPRAE